MRCHRPTYISLHFKTNDLRYALVHSTAMSGNKFLYSFLSDNTYIYRRQLVVVQHRLVGYTLERMAEERNWRMLERRWPELLVE